MENRINTAGKHIVPVFSPPLQHSTPPTCAILPPEEEADGLAATRIKEEKTKKATRPDTCRHNPSLGP